MDNTARECSEPKANSVHRYSTGETSHFRSIGNDGDRSHDTILPKNARMAERINVGHAGLPARVYDIRNCGPRHRFAVWNGSHALIVSNCVQAIARDCLAEAVERLEAAGFPVVFHVHDEVIIDAAPFGDSETMLQRVVDIMKQQPSWAPGLPLNGDGWVGAYYKKD